MIEIIKPTITKEVDANGQYGKFVIEPLERGYGTTLGNCMRRVLLSSLPGAAITSVKIDGILHEFSTIPGVKEDVTEIILNLKRLAVRIDGNEDKRAIINAVGPKEVTAADIIKIAMNRVYRALRREGLKSRLILQIHDELIIHTDQEELEQVKQLLTENMEAAVTMQVALKADLNVGENWYELK